MMFFFFFFFFSSRRRHTRCLSDWSSDVCSSDLVAGNPTDKMICLRGYLRLAGQSEVPLDKRLAMCREAVALAKQDEEKKLLLAALGSIVTVEAVDLITPYLNNSGPKEEAVTGIVS